MRIADYIKKLLSLEEYSFSLDEIRKQTGKKDISIQGELSRLTGRGEIINLRKGFYLIIPPRYSMAKTLPVQLYCDKLFKFLEKRYYLGVFSAARMHGAGHQQVQRDYIISEKPKLNDIKKNSTDIRFFTSSNWPEGNILTKKSDAGNFNISSPALTMVDLIHYQTKLGGINRILGAIEELGQELQKDDLIELLEWYPNKSALQRLGFLLESMDMDLEFQELIFSELKKRKFFPVLISPGIKEKPGAVYNKWKVDVNVNLQYDS